MLYFLAKRNVVSVRQHFSLQESETVSLLKVLKNSKKSRDNNCTIMNAWHLCKRGSIFTAQRYIILCNGISFCDVANDCYNAVEFTDSS